MTLLIGSLLARLVLALVFVVAGLAKLAQTDKTREMLAGFGVGRGMLTLLAFALPLVELAVAVALIVPPAAYAGAVVAFALLALFTGAILFHLAQGRHPVCNCFGQIDATPIGLPTLVRNGVLTGLALLVLAAGPGVAGIWRLDQVFGITPLAALAGAAAVVALVLLLLIALAQVTILHHLSQLQTDATSSGAAYALPTASHGLPEGSLAPSFGLSDTRGEFITLEQLLAARRPLILLFTKSDCPPCLAMADEVDRWCQIHAHLLEIVRIYDSADAPRDYALLQAKGAVAQAYDCWGTPCAVLVTPDGHIGSRTAQGAAAIRALVKRAVAASTEGSLKAV